jgi:hypothetical protein
MVLHGFGVTVTSTAKLHQQSGITSAAFRNGPHIPFESIEVTIPAGPFSEFGANLVRERKIPLLWLETGDADPLRWR